MKVNVYMDGFNLYYGAVKGTPYKWLDVACLCRAMQPNDTINRIRYYTALVEPRLQNPDQLNRQRTFIRALLTIPNLSVHYGHFLSHVVTMHLAPPQKGYAQVIKTEEKGSDVNLATHLLADGFRNDTATFFKSIREVTLRKCQFPETLTDSRGSFSKPSTW